MRRERLERLLRVRTVQERVARAAWAAAEVAASRAEARTDALARERAHARSRLVERQACGAADADEARAAHVALDGLDRAVVSTRDRARDLRARAVEARAPWLERRIDVRGLQRLRDRARAAARDERLAHELREQDDRAAAVAARPSPNTPAPDRRDRR